MSDPSPSTTLIPGPPFRDPGADLILRSSDGVEFHVHRVVLGLLSHIFRDMFALPQPDSETGIPEVRMPESGVVLDRILRFCYPGAEPVVQTLGQLQEILQILGDKYALRGFIQSEPLGSFAVAARHSWPELALAAARECLRLPLRTSCYQAPLELDCISGTTYHSLFQYHYRCGMAAQNVCQNLEWMPSSIRWHHSCTCTAFAEYLRAMGGKLAVVPAPTDDHVLISKALKEMEKCERCPMAMYDELPRFISMELWPKIKSKIENVSPHLS
ncbi:hypothetical protein FB451DRAFT_1057840 [Mycena latifolia]|nr:hypothetical protein FB451DRAFT_1057840 [Mycena latifolia]